jgi:hypothetical protein
VVLFPYTKEPKPPGFGSFSIICLFFVSLHLGEAFAAVYRAIFTGLEGNAGFAAAASAGGSEHFTFGAGGILAGVTAGLAALGLVYKASFSVEFLFAGGEYKFVAAFFAYQGLVFVHLFYLAFGYDCVTLFVVQSESGRKRSEQ